MTVPTYPCFECDEIYTSSVMALKCCDGDFEELIDDADRIQIIDKADELVATVETSIVPEKDDLILIDDTEYHVYHKSHIVDGGGLITSVFCSEVDDRRMDMVESTVRRTLRYQMQKHEEWANDE